MIHLITGINNDDLFNFTESLIKKELNIEISDDYFSRIYNYVFIKDIKQTVFLDSFNNTASINKYKDADHNFIIFTFPEKELHPSLQAKLVQNFIKLEKLGFNLYIITHSDHILYSILIECKKYDDSNGQMGVSNEKIIIYYLFEEEPFVTEVKIEQGGKIRKFPDNFFDQHKKYIRELL